MNQINDIDLTRLIARILRHKILAISVAFLVFAAAFAYSKLATRFYDTTIKFVYQSAKQGGNLSALAALAGVSLDNKSDDGSAYMEDIVKSTDFLSQIINNKWLIIDTTKTTDTLTPISLEEFWEIKLDSTITNKEEILSAIIIGKITEQIKYMQDKKTGIISITTSFEDPKLSYEINEVVFRELNNTLMNKMHFKASENRKFIERRLAEIKDDLKKSEGALLSFEQRNRSWSDPSILLQRNRLAREVTINQELALQLQKQYELAKIEESKDMPLLDVIESPRRALGYSKPKPKIILAIGFIGAIILGLSTALGFDLLNKEFKSLVKQILKAQKELEN